jgi:hypothetical protein
VGAVVAMLSVSVFWLMLPLRQPCPPPGLKDPVASEGRPLQVKVSGKELGLNPFEGVTVRLIVAVCPAGTE